MKPEQLAAHLSEGKLAALYLIHGADPLGRLEAADAIRARARELGFSERECFSVTPGFQWQQLFMAADNLSLFGEAKIVELTLPTGKPGREGGDALIRLAERGAAPDLLTLILLPEVDWATRKTKWFTALQKAAVTLEYAPPERARLPAWLAERLARQDQRASKDALEWLADHTEGNLLAAHQEVLKLGLLYPPGELAREDIERAVLDVSRHDTNTLRTAWLAGEPARLQRILDTLQGEAAAPPLVLWAITQEIRALAQLAEARAQGIAPQQVFQRERIFDRARQQALLAALPRYRLPQLYKLLQASARIDRIIKGIAAGDVWHEFARLRPL